MKFIYAKELKKEYVVYARFYRLQYNHGEIIEGRNLLLIFNKDKCKQLTPDAMLMDINKPDAIFIMMNPGSSKANKKDYTAPLLTENDIIEYQKIDSELIETKPDTTQYQIMRIMKAKNWNYVKVINLSDLREANSNTFCKKINAISEFDANNIHSIFSEKRIAELNNVFVENHNHKVIVAWGVNKKLKNIIELALENPELERRIGNNKADDDNGNFFYYYHPLPQKKEKKIEWLENMLEKL